MDIKKLSKRILDISMSNLTLLKYAMKKNKFVELENGYEKSSEKGSCFFCKEKTYYKKFDFYICKVHQDKFSDEEILERTRISENNSININFDRNLLAEKHISNISQDKETLLILNSLGL